MRPPAKAETIKMVIGGTEKAAVCTDVFDGGWGWYFDATFPKSMRYRFSTGEQCPVPSLGTNRVADFVSYPTNELWKVRFLISK